MSRQFCCFLGIAIFGMALPGCLTFLHPLPEPPCEVCEQFESIHEDSRAGVYVFMVNGNDPLCCANLKGVRDFLSRLGFVKCYCGEICHEGWMAEELVCIHRDHPESRFVVVGFEYGADSARRIVQAGLDKGATIDMLLYLEPKGTFFNLSASDPGIHRTVVVQNDRWLTKCAPVDDSEVITVSTRNRYGMPTHPAVLELLTAELSHLAAMVPIIVYAPEPIPPLLEEVAPTPRPMLEKKAEPPDDWDFLKLISQRPLNTTKEAPSLVGGSIPTDNYVANPSTIGR